MAYYFMKFISWLACRFSLKSCISFGNGLGKWTWKLVPKKRRAMAIENIMTCLGVDEKRAEEIAKASWVQFGPLLMEVLYYPRLFTEGKIKEYVSVEGLDYIKEAVAQGRGGIIATSHSDNWELMGATLAQYGIPLVGVAMKQKNDEMNKFIVEYREMSGMYIAYKSDVRALFRLIKEGKMIGLIMDQDPSLQDGILVDFFGRVTNCVTGPAVLARMQKAPIFPAHIMHKSPQGHHIKVEAPIYVPEEGNKEDNIKATMQLLSHILEEHIRKHPEDWFWLHDRWKSVRNAGL